MYIIEHTFTSKMHMLLIMLRLAFYLELRQISYLSIVLNKVYATFFTLWLNQKHTNSIVT